MGEQIFTTVSEFIATLKSIDWTSMFSWLPPAFGGAVIAIAGILIALRILEVL